MLKFINYRPLSRTCSAIVLFLLLSSSYSGIAQLPQHFIPSPPVTKDSTLVARLEKRYKQEKDTISFTVKKGRDFIAEQCSLRNDFIKARITEEYFLSGSYIDRYVQQIAKEILSKNPELSYGITVLVSRDPEPNAYALGNGIVIFNIGMLKRLHTEAEIAFILCHEFSHDYLHHGNNDLYKTAERIVDKELEEQLKAAVKEEYNTKKKVFALLLPGLKKSRQYNREQELQADSIGMKFLSKTRYNLQGGVTVMDVLDSLDIRQETEVINLRKFFTIPQVPPGKYWFEYQGASSLGGGFEEEKDTLADSLKTHPDCKVRKETLSRIINNKSGGELFLQTADSFRLMQYDSEGEYIQLWLDWYYMDRSIYNALFYLEKYPSNVFPRATLALSLAFISMKQKNLQAGNYLAMPSPDYDESFNRLLQMLREINPKENGLLSYWMIRPIDEDLKKTEVYLAALVLSAYSAAKPDEYASLRAEYNTKFPEGRYLQFFPVEEEKKK